MSVRKHWSERRTVKWHPMANGLRERIGVRGPGGATNGATTAGDYQHHSSTGDGTLDGREST